MKEMLKDFGYGIATVGGIFGLIFALISTMEFLGAQDDTIKLMLAVPFFVYFIYLFGGLTRSIYFKK